MANFILNEVGATIEEYFAAIRNFLVGGEVGSDGSLTAKEVSVTTDDGVEHKLSKSVSQEQLNTAINTEKERAISKETVNADNITACNEDISSLENDLSTEITRAKAAEAKTIGLSIVASPDDNTMKIGLFNADGAEIDTEDIPNAESAHSGVMTWKQAGIVESLPVNDDPIPSVIDATTSKHGLMSIADKKLIEGTEALNGQVLQKTDTGVAWKTLTGLLTETQMEQINALLESIPLEIVLAGNSGTYETGTKVKPEETISVMYGFSDVSGSATLACDTGTIEYNVWSAGEEISTGALYHLSAAYNGKYAYATPRYVFMHYRYRGVIDTLPESKEGIADIVKSVSKEFYEIATLDETQLAAGKYYFFAVVGEHNLVIKTGGGETVDPELPELGTTVELNRQNGTGTDTYTFVFVPKSTVNWSFYIECND